MFVGTVKPLSKRFKGVMTKDFLKDDENLDTIRVISNKLIPEKTSSGKKSLKVPKTSTDGKKGLDVKKSGQYKVKSYYNTITCITCISCI